MTDELEIFRFIRLQKQARFAVKTIFSRFQLWLLQNQKMFVINPDTDSSDARSSDEPHISERVLKQEKDLITFQKLWHNALNRRKGYIEQQATTKEEQDDLENMPEFGQSI